LQKDLEEQWHEATITVGRLQNYIDEIRSLHVTRSQVHAFVEYMSSVQKGESKPVDLLYARAGEDAGRWCGKEGAKETVPWAHADTLLRRLGFEPGRRSPHESVLSRPRGKTYEERIKDLGPKKKGEISTDDLRSKRNRANRSGIFRGQAPGRRAGLTTKNVQV